MLINALISSTYPYLPKKSPPPFCPPVIFVLRVPMYYFSSGTSLDMNMLPVSCLASCSVARRMSHIDCDHPVSTFGPMFKFFRASSLISLPNPINFRLFMLTVSRENVSVLTASNAAGILRNSFPLMNSCFQPKPFSLLSLGTGGALSDSLAAVFFFFFSFIISNNVKLKKNKQESWVGQQNK